MLEKRTMPSHMLNTLDFLVDIFSPTLQSENKNKLVIARLKKRKWIYSERINPE